MQLAPEQSTAALAFYAWKCAEVESMLGQMKHAMDGLAAKNKELEGQLQALTQAKPAAADSEGGEAA